MSDRSHDPFQPIHRGKEASAPLATKDLATLTRYQLLILDHLRIEPGRPRISVAPSVEPEQIRCTTAGAPDEGSVRSCARSIVGRRPRRLQEKFLNFKSGRTKHIILAISIAGLIAVSALFQFLRSYEDPQGGVSKSSEQLIRISSLRLNGAAVQLLDRQMLPRPWGDQLVTGVHVEKNEIYSAAIDFLDRFASPISADVLLSDASVSALKLAPRPIADYVGQQMVSAGAQPSNLEAKRSLGNIYLGGKDGQARLSWPGDTGVAPIPSDGADQWRSAHQPDASGKKVAWRPFGLKDFEARSVGPRKTMRQVTHNSASPNSRLAASSGKEANGLVSQVVRHLTKTHWPKDFMILKREREQGRTSFYATLRQFQLEMVLIENKADRSIKIGKLHYGQIGTYELEDYDRRHAKLLKSSSRLARRIRAARVLKAGEKLLVPVGITFAYPTGLVDENPSVPNLRDRRAPEVKSEKVERFAFYAGSSGRTRPSLSMANASTKKLKPIVDRYIYGPSWLLHSLEVDDQLVELELTSYDYASVLFVWRSENYCVISTKESGAGRWGHSGGFELGGAGTEKSYAHTVSLPAFDGSVRLEIDGRVGLSLESARLELKTEAGVGGFMVPLGGAVTSEKPLIISADNPAIMKFPIKNSGRYAARILHLKGGVLPLDGDGDGDGARARMRVPSRKKEDSTSMPVSREALPVSRENTSVQTRTVRWQ